MKHNKIIPNLFLFALIALMFSCETENLPDVQQGEFLDAVSAQEIGFNQEQQGEFVYTYIKHYMGSLDPYLLIPSQIREDFRSEFEAKISTMKAQDFDYFEHLDQMVLAGVYSEQQTQLLKQQHQELHDFLGLQRPSSDEAWEWMLRKEADIKQAPGLSLDERSALLSLSAMSRYVLKYRIEVHELSNLEDVKHLSENRTSTCGFWNQAFCYLGIVKAFADLANTYAGAVKDNPNTPQNESEINNQENIKIAASAVGVVRGTQTAITSCTCNTNVCKEFVGVSFAYTCYSTGDPITFTGWGQGTITPDNFVWEFSKNNNTVDVFWSNFTSGPSITVPGSELQSNNVSYISIDSDVLCSGTPKFSRHGWFKISDLGQPIGMVTGDNYFHISQASGLKWYSLSGPVESSPNVSYSWQLITFPWYGGPPVNATLNGGSNQTVSVNWGTNPGPATLRVTATSSCGSRTYDYGIFIYP